MAKKAYRVRNWKDYNKALVNRGSLTFWFSEEIVKGWRHTSERCQRGRQKYYADSVIQCGLVLRQLYRLPLRTTEGMVKSLAQLLNIKERVPNYTTLCRRGKTLTIKFVEAIRASDKRARHVLIDSTGVRVVGEGEWKTLRHGASRCQVWKKLHITMDADSQEILSAEMTESVRLDGNYLAGLIHAIPGPIEQVTGDGAYDKKSCYEACFERGAKAVFPPQHNACVQRNRTKRNPALEQRDVAIGEVGRGEGREEKLKLWKQTHRYHRRSLVETAMFRLKTLFGDEMRARTEENQRTDLFIRCWIINKMNRLGLPVSTPVL